MKKSVQSFQDLHVYQLAFQCSVDVYDLVQQFPDPADDPLAHQVLSTAHSVRAHIAAAWGQRGKRDVLIDRLSSAQLDAMDVQINIETAICAGYLDAEVGQDLCDRYRCISTALDHLMETAAVGTSTDGRYEHSLPATA